MMWRVPARWAPAMTRVLGIALVIVTLLPILIFATDFTNSRTLQTARAHALKRAGVTERAESDSVRRERIRVRRARIHPSAMSFLAAMGFQLVMLTAMAIVGHRLFVLRL